MATRKMTKQEQAELVLLLAEHEGEDAGMTDVDEKTDRAMAEHGWVRLTDARGDWAQGDTPDAYAIMTDERTWAIGTDENGETVWGKQVKGE